MLGARTRLEREREDRIEAAWMIAGLSRVAKLPRLERLLGRESGKAVGPAAVGARLAALNKVLPTITQEEWRARVEASRGR
ncbi:hypothetical protein [Cereibacter sphaeroides]|jgi:hypothetical protein|uniref:hypothetical protein n=1 Tax=Cereibacter sphaeroides TaxID=1063 RepID=UPI0000F29E2E|nr:hypothetical protein Rsph17029_0635 [Cereibacter sphaeroides ATCC 17029]